MIPLATTTVTVRRGSGTGDPYEADTATVVASRLPAHVSGPGGSADDVGGAQEVVDARLLMDITPCLTRIDRVTDEQTGRTYEVVWSRVRQGLGLDHQVAGLRAVAGSANG